MPAQSEQQRKLFGLALSVKRGDTPRSQVGENILDIVDSMSEDKIRDFALKESKQNRKKELIESVLKESNEDEKFSLTVTFENLGLEDLQQLQGMFKSMEWAGSVGSSGGFKIFVDGDGNFRSKIKIDPEPSEEISKKYIEQFDNEKMNIDLGC